jgi:hypothetical protein
MISAAPKEFAGDDVGNEGSAGMEICAYESESEISSDEDTRDEVYIICMHVCMHYVCVYVCTYVHVSLWYELSLKSVAMKIREMRCMYVYMYVRVYVCMYVRMRVSLRMLV